MQDDTFETIEAALRQITGSLVQARELSTQKEDKAMAGLVKGRRELAKSRIELLESLVRAGKPLRLPYLELLTGISETGGENNG